MITKKTTTLKIVFGFGVFVFIVAAILSAVIAILNPFQLTYHFILRPISMLISLFMCILSWLFYDIFNELDLNGSNLKSLVVNSRMILKCNMMIVIMLIMSYFVYRLADIDDAPGMLVLYLLICALLICVCRKVKLVQDK